MKKRLNPREPATLLNLDRLLDECDIGTGPVRGVTFTPKKARARTRRYCVEIMTENLGKPVPVSTMKIIAVSFYMGCFYTEIEGHTDYKITACKFSHS